MTERIDGVYSAPIEPRKTMRLNLRIVNRLLFALIIGGGIYYIVTVNDLVVKSFVLQELKARRTALAEESRNLDIKITSLKSYNNLAKRIEKLEMVSADNVEYVKAPKEVVAFK